MPLIKMWNHDRSIRKTVKVTDLKGLLNVGRQKLGYHSEELKSCLETETDVTGIDDKDILQDFFHQKDALQVSMISYRMGARVPASSLLVYHALSEMPTFTDYP